MFKLFSLKNQQDNVERKVDHSRRFKSAAELRIQKDIHDLDLPKTCQPDFPDPDDLFTFKIIICPDNGFYHHGRFVFSLKISRHYPHEPPKVRCETSVYHPNIDLEGNVCLNILREDWKPVMTLNVVALGLQFLFLEPNAEDPLNKEAAAVLIKDRTLFKRNVKSAMNGGSIDGVKFQKCIL